MPTLLLLLLEMCALSRSDERSVAVENAPVAPSVIEFSSLDTCELNESRQSAPCKFECYFDRNLIFELNNNDFLKFQFAKIGISNLFFAFKSIH